MLHLIKTLSSLFFLFTFFIQADVIDITLIDNPPYFTDELSRYLTTVSNDIEPCVGFNAINIGDGKGDGHNEIIAFSFIFQPLTEIETAYLILDITPRGTSTDELLFADNWSIRGAGVAGERYYGNTILRTLPNIRALVTFDLKHISFCDPSMEPVGFEDISYLLCDGDFNVVYADDAILHSARLSINCDKKIIIPPQNPDKVIEPTFLFFIMVSLLVIMCIKFTVKFK